MSEPDSEPDSELEVVTSDPVMAVWAGTSAEFALRTHGDRQYVAFYDADRNATAGMRRLDEREWTFARLPEERKIEWDAHNDLALAIDPAGHLHVAGNMHVHPLNYFRTTEPADVRTLERVPEMIGRREARVTYPRFFHGPHGNLCFEYRDGGSGAGDWIYNRYDHETRRWERLLEEPLLRGGERMSAYPHGPILGPDGAYHCCWVWRDSPDASTNHDLSYARSPDLRNWETSLGEELEVPITLERGEVVDPVPPGGGLINGNAKIGFDATGRVVLSYHKDDDDGNTQLYLARAPDTGKRSGYGNRSDDRGVTDWEIVRATDWDYRWEFGSEGSIPFEIEVGPVTVEDDPTRLRLPYEHVAFGLGAIRLDAVTLEPIEDRSPWSRYPPVLLESAAADPGMQVNWVADGGETPPGTEYALRWEALEPNRDRERERTPPATTLHVYEFERNS